MSSLEAVLSKGLVVVSFEGPEVVSSRGPEAVSSKGPEVVSSEGPEAVSSRGGGGGQRWCCPESPFPRIPLFHVLDHFKNRWVLFNSLLNSANKSSGGCWPGGARVVGLLLGSLTF